MQALYLRIRLVFISIFVLVNLVLTACSQATTSPVYVATPTQISTITAPKPSPTETVPKLSNGILISIFPELTRLSDAKSFRLEDDWDGNIGYAPIIAHYSLTLNGSQLEGTAEFGSDGRSMNPRKATYPISIPATIAQDFLQILAQLPLQEGKYEPKKIYTDNYPSIKIEVDVNTGDKLTVFTRSQDQNNVPWAVAYANRTFVVNSDMPLQALKKLEPYLKKDALRNLVGVDPGWCGPGFPCR